MKAKRNLKTLDNLDVNFHHKPRKQFEIYKKKINKKILKTFAVLQPNLYRVR